MTDDENLGRRSADRYPGPEAVGVILVQLARDIAEMKQDIRDGFRGVAEAVSRHDERLRALEGFRTRVEERDRALAKSEGNLTFRLPVVALFLTLVAVAVATATLLLSHT